MRLRFCLVNLLIFLSIWLQFNEIFFSIENYRKERIVTVSHFTQQWNKLELSEHVCSLKFIIIVFVGEIKMEMVAFFVRCVFRCWFKVATRQCSRIWIFFFFLHAFSIKKIFNLVALNPLWLNESKRNFGKWKFIFAADHFDWSNFFSFLQMLFTFYSDRPNEWPILNCLFHLRYHTTASTTVNTYLFVCRDTRKRCRYIIRYEQIIKIVRVKRVCLNKCVFFSS